MDYYEGGVIGEAGWVLLLVFITVTLALLLTYLLDRENDVAPMKTSNNTVKDDTDEGVSSKQVVNVNDGGGWKCACEGGGIFLPQSLQRSVGGPSAFLKAGTGNCYHKQM